MSVSSPDATGVLQSIESIWIDKIVMVEYGIYDFSMGDYQWFKLGTFVLSNSSYGFGVGEQQVDMNLIDLMGLASDPVVVKLVMMLQYIWTLILKRH